MNTIKGITRMLAPSSKTDVLVGIAAFLVIYGSIELAERIYDSCQEHIEKQTELIKAKAWSDGFHAGWKSHENSWSYKFAMKKEES